MISITIGDQEETGITEMAAGEFYSSMQNYLLGILGQRWEDVRLAMVNVFIDDSGTAPEHKVAIASALIVESRQIVALDKAVGALAEQEGFMGENGFPDFHTSECAAGNVKSKFAGWGEGKKRRVCDAMRRIAMNYGLNACSIAIDKGLYDELIPRDSELRARGGAFHYTWAVRELLQRLEWWADAQNHEWPLEYVFDCMGPNVKNRRKREVEKVLAAAERAKPGFYTEHHAFRCRNQNPALQCVDILAWTCYRYALAQLAQEPLPEIAKAGFDAFSAYQPNGVKWLLAIVQTREQLKEWVSTHGGATIAP